MQDIRPILAHPKCCSLGQNESAPKTASRSVVSVKSL